MTRDQAVGPLSRSIRVDRMARAQGDFIVTATPEECAALAADFGIPGIRDLVGRFRVGGTLENLSVTGSVEAVVTQICTVSLDEFEAPVHETVDVAFTDGEIPTGHDAEEIDVPDPIVNGRVDFGLLTAEFLAMGLDPYPRKPGVTFAEPEPDADGAPLAGLRALQGGKD
ncbi:metal-binding protein [Methylobacterium sp. Leaf469]|uniref:YceD family protein n=1 Tax=unclassified Methylobacterium TaxID=2615210 RepID=UPI0006F5438E|nr:MULTISPECIES: DUF177 domain-containing protein [unclassified Methylobacterium]KQP21890.1 metal-binding protein [Methylobacterium sp. Leaf102]KQU00828.1 metal-binding protein [Methylobacterium sp. Leaf469]USU32703.1 YceD family protein [Methylobacterium sp. OTU13CASTA1]